MSLDANHAASAPRRQLMTPLRDFLRQFGLGVAVSSLMLPGAIAVATTFLFLTSPHAGKACVSSAKSTLHCFPVWNSILNRSAPRACFFGALIAVGFCALLAVTVGRRYTRARSACPGQFNQLQQGFERVDGRVRARCKGEDPPPACSDAVAHRDYLRAVFSRPDAVGLPWLFATGYVDAWRRLHAIEESLL